jgi:membrane protease YdiL (CAAX protease family)
MTRWRIIAETLASDMRPWQVIYMIVFAVYSAIANLTIAPENLQAAMVWLYLLFSLGSVAIVLPGLRRSLFRINDPLRNPRFSRPWGTRFWWRLYLYVLVPLFFIALLQTFSAIGSAFLQFDQSNVSQKPTILDYVGALLAGTEEIWRWSMIATVLVVSRLFLGRLWERTGTPQIIFFIALCLSSLAFGSAHILEFTKDRLGALILFSGLGLILALMTVVTGRILLVMFVHIGYDLWVTMLSATTSSSSVVWISIVYLALLGTPIVTLIWRRQIFATYWNRY